MNDYLNGGTMGAVLFKRGIMPDDDVERCAMISGSLICVLKKQHEGGCLFRDVPFQNRDPLLSAFCPYCGSRPLVEGPGCRKCDADAE